MELWLGQNGELWLGLNRELWLGIGAIVRAE